MPARRRDPRLVEQPAEDHRAPRREVVAVVVEERVDLVGLLGEALRRADPLRELLVGVEPVEAVGGAAAADVPGLGVAAVEADHRDRVRRGRDARRDVRGAGERRIDRDVREPLLLEEAERVRALVELHPGAVAELDQRHERVEPVAREGELGLRLGRLDEPGVVLEQDAAELARELERLDRRAELGKGAVGRLALVEGHRRARLDVEGELVRRPLGPAPRHVGVGQRVEGRVDLDDVEALGVVAQARGGRRDAAWVPRLEQALVGPAARPEAHRRRHGCKIETPRRSRCDAGSPGSRSPGGMRG